MKTPRIVIDHDRHEVHVHGKAVHLAPKEWEILILLHASKKVQSRDSLMEAVWGHKAEGIDTRTVDQHVARLRRKVGAEVIETVTAYGYRIAA